MKGRRQHDAPLTLSEQPIEIGRPTKAGDETQHSSLRINGNKKDVSRVIEHRLVIATKKCRPQHGHEKTGECRLVNSNNGGQVG